jgi:orotate phosphoribosyltransferase
MTEAEAIQLFETSHALVQNNHFVYTSGRHGSVYVNKDAVYLRPAVLSQLCLGMASFWKDRGIDAVVGPALGGIALSQWVSHHLQVLTGHEVLAIYAEKNPAGGFTLTRGYDEAVAEKKVLIVEDILTTGSSVQKLIQALNPFDCQIVGVAALWNRGGVSREMFTPSSDLHALIARNFESYEEALCPLCEKKVPFHPRLGKRK